MIAGFTAIQLLFNIHQQQQKLYISIVIASILWLISLRANSQKISGLFLLVCAIAIVDIYIGFIPGISSLSKAWIEQSTVTSLAMLIAILLVIELVNKKNIEVFYGTLIFLSGLILLGTLFELFYLKSQPGRIVTGYQNISSAILLISIPLINKIESINFRIKLIIIAILFLTIVFIFKSRFSTFIGLIYTIYLILDNKRINWHYKLIFGSFFVFTFTGAFYFTDRFLSLINGNDLWVRLGLWERLFTAGAGNFLFGVGFGNISVLTSSWQFINPSVELITTFNTFFSAHNDLLERFIYGGIVSVLISISINLLIIYCYFKNKKYELKNELVIYLILFFHSLIDIHNSTLTSLIIFNFFQLYLVFKIYEKSNFHTSYLKFSILILLFPSITYIYKKDDLRDHVAHYQVTANNMIAGRFFDSDISRIESQSPHFMRFDFIDMQTYLMHKSGQGFNQTLFETKLLNSRKYNKYYLPQIHVSSQYYSFISDERALTEIYSDYLYYKLINMNIINISFRSSGIQVVLYDKNHISMVDNQNSKVLYIPRNIFGELRRVNSSFGSLKLSDDFFVQNLNNFTYTGSGDAVKAKAATKEFLEGINKFSENFFLKK